jgi:hypothetical protein
MRSSFGLYLVSILSLFSLYWVFIWSLWFPRSSLRGTRFARTPRFAPLILYLVFMVSTELASGHSLRSHPSLRSAVSLLGLYWVFIWSLMGLYLVFIGSLLGLYLVSIGCLLGLYLVCILGLY